MLSAANVTEQHPL